MAKLLLIPYIKKHLIFIIQSYIASLKKREKGKFPFLYSLFCHNFNTFAYRLNKLG